MSRGSARRGGAPPAGQPAQPGWVERSGGVTLRLAVVPNAKRTAADGWHDGALRVRLVAPPVEGKANDQLIEWLAHELGLPQRAVRVARGATARRKQVEIDTAPERVAAWLNIVAPGG
jgi:uncharacterized protein (TIGR00251 family)